jgi:hypothetical protein
MDALEWLPSITTTSLFAVALWLCRNLIATRLTKSVQHEFDAKLEAVRAEFRRKEQLLKADLQSKQADILALRSGAMTAIASRQVALDKRRLEAVDQLWSAVSALAPAKAISAMVSTFKFEAAAERAARDSKFRDFVATIGRGFDLNALDLSGAAKARPFVSPMVWALFSAYHTIVTFGALKLAVLKGGLDVKGIFDNDTIARLIKTALPHQTRFVDEHGASGYHLLLDELETRLIDEIPNMLSGKELDIATVQQAADILNLTSQLSNRETQNRPPPE